MTGVYEPVADSESLIQQPVCDVASRENNILFDDLLTVHQDVPQNNFPPSALAIFTGENNKKSSGDPLGFLKGNEKIGSNKVETKRSTFPELLSNTGNFLFIAANLLTGVEKDNIQFLTTDDNMQAILSCTVESPDRNTSQKYSLLKDAHIFNSTPLVAQSGQKEDNIIQNLLTETTLKSLSENEVLSLFEQCEDNRLNVKEDNFIDPAKKNPPLPGDLQALSSSKTNADDHINPGFRINQFMILQGDRGGDIQIVSDGLCPPSLTNTESSSPLKTLVQGEQYTQNKGHSAAADTPRQIFLRIVQPRINTVPYVTDAEGKDNMGFQEKSHIISPKDFSPSEIEEITPPPAGASLKSTIVRGVSSLIEDFVKREGSTEKEHSKTQSPETHITESGDPFPLLDNKNRNENSPLRVQILQEPQKAASFVLPKKGDASIEVSLETEGLGKIDIELTLDRGIVNAQITTSEIISKEIIERNLHTILSSLTDEGLNIGSFSVSLRNRQGNMSESNGKEAQKTLPAIKEIRIPVRLADSRMISIFV